VSHSPLFVTLTTATLLSAFAIPANADPEVTDLASRNDGDAAAGRSYVAPTALTTPAGETAISVRWPVFPAIHGNGVFGVTDWLEVTGGAGAYLVPEDESYAPPEFFDAGVKVRLLRTRHVAIAATATAFMRRAYESSDPFDGGTMHRPAELLGEVGAVATVCIDASCGAIVSIHGHYLGDVQGGDDDRKVWGGASLVAGRGRSLLVLDATLYVERDSGDDFGIGYIGYRNARQRFSADAGFLIIRDDRHVTIPWPTLGLSARF
jgi:hypothetical protein